MKRYLAYKDCDIEWIGEIPNHWNLGIMKYRLSANDGGVWGSDCDDDSTGTFVIRSTEITIDGKWDLTNPMKRNLESKEKAKSKLYKGDIVITKSSGSPDHIGKSVIVDDYVEKLDCCFSNFVQRIRFDKDLPLLYHYILNSEIVREQYRFLTHSTTGLGNLSSSTFDNVNIPYIPLSEQLQITNYLKHKTLQIDDVIAKKQKLIELMREECAVIINHTVSKGLDTKVPMKDSGIEWLGEIPEHWKLTNIKKITTKIGSGVTPKGGADVYVETGIPFFRSQNIHFSGIRTDEIVFIPTDVHEKMSASKMNKDDVLLNITGASIGRCCVYEGQLGEANVNQHVCILRTTPNVNPYVLYYFLSSEAGQIQIDLGNTGSGREGLNFKNIGNFVFPMIPPDEQIQMVKYLNAMSKSIETIIIKAHKEIELLSEYKTSLINETVTGKIDVRDYQINND